MQSILYKIENEMDRYAVAVTRGQESVSDWDNELNKLNTLYKWGEIKTMIEEQAHKGGIF